MPVQEHQPRKSDAVACLRFGSLKHRYGKDEMKELQSYIRNGNCSGRRQGTVVWLCCAAAMVLGAAVPAQAGFVGYYDFNNFAIVNSDPVFGTGTAMTPDGGLSAILTGSNSGTFFDGYTDLVIAAPASGVVKFDFSYSSLDIPMFDFGGFVISGVFTAVADTDGQTGTNVSFFVNQGEIFGFRVYTSDNSGEPGQLTITNFDAPENQAAAVPEPGFFPVILCLLGAILWYRYRAVGLARVSRNMVAAAVVAGLLASVAPANAQQTSYAGTQITGQLALVRTVNLTALGQQQALLFGLRTQTAETPRLALLKRRVPPPVQRFQLGTSSALTLTPPPMVSLTINPSTAGFGFNGLTHAQQRNSNGGNQFSLEPPNPAIGVGNGYVLQGVNNAVQVFSAITGLPLLPNVVSSNQLFGLAPAIDRTTGINGPSPTDMRVIYDQGINRFIVMQGGIDNDVAGNPINSSHFYMAVSQTGDPLGNYNIYIMDTTNAGNFAGCPCVADYPQIGSDQYGLYISANEFNTFFNYYVDSVILAISKPALAAGAPSPTMVRFTIPYFNNTDFAIQPATVPAGAANVLAYGGGQFFVSSSPNATYPFDTTFAVWLMSNTSSLLSSPALMLTSSQFNALPYGGPDVANQKSGPLPYGSSLGQSLAFLDGNDSRMLSVSYAGGRLFASLATTVFDEGGQRRVGAAYLVLSPTYRNGALAANVVRQGYLLVRGNHLLRPSLAVNAQGKGAVAVTLVGQAYYPSAALIPFDVASTPTTLQIASLGTGPEDGFSGYFPSPTAPVARWGDYSAAVASADGQIWMATEYIPNLPRTPLANWGTYIVRFTP